MGQDKGIKWTPQQIKIFELAKENKGTAEIAKLLGCSNPTVTKIKNAIKKGETPSDKKPQVKETISTVKKPHVIPKTSNPLDVKQTVSQYKNSTGSDSESEAEQPLSEGHDQEQEEETTEGTETGNQKQETTKQETSKPPKASPPPSGITTVMKMVAVPVNVAITPIMQNARILAMEEWGWKGDMPWEDFFDTIIYLFCQNCGYEIKGYYKVDQDGNPIGKDEKPIKQASASSPPGGNGTGDKEYDEADMKLGIEIAKYLKMMKKKEVQHAS